MADLLRPHAGRRVVVHIGGTSIAGTLQQATRDEITLIGAEHLLEHQAGVDRQPLDGVQVLRRAEARWVQVLT